MRFNLIRGVKKVKWRHLMFEILLIVVAINVGLWFNNLNDKGKERKLEVKILREFLVSLESDKNDIFLNIETHKLGVESCSRLLDTVPYKNSETMLRNLGNSNSWTFLLADQSSYESLKSIGFQLISNDEIRRAITKLYNVDYENIAERENNHKRICLNFDEKARNVFQEIQETTSLNESIHQLSKKSFYDLKSLIQSHIIMKKLYEEEIIPIIDDLILKIEAELKV